MAASVERARSVSSMRSRTVPPWRRAYSQLNNAVRAPPMCRYPVGEGAKRVTGGANDDRGGAIASTQGLLQSFAR